MPLVRQERRLYRTLVVVTVVIVVVFRDVLDVFVVAHGRSRTGALVLA